MMRSMSSVVVVGILTLFGSSQVFADYGDFDQVKNAIIQLNQRAANAVVPEGEAVAGQITLGFLVAVRTDPQPNGTQIGDVVPKAVVKIKQTMTVRGVVWYLIEWDPNTGVVQWPGNAQPAVLYGATPSAGWIHGKSLTVTLVQGARQAPPAATIYDVYYWSADGNKWVWYAGYYDGADVDRAIANVKAQGFAATWQKRS